MTEHLYENILPGHCTQMDWTDTRMINKGFIQYDIPPDLDDNGYATIDNDPDYCEATSMLLNLKPELPPRPTNLPRVRSPISLVEKLRRWKNQRLRHLALCIYTKSL